MDWSYSSLTPLYSCSDLWTCLWHQGQHQLTRKRSGPSYTCPRSSYQHHSLPWIPRSNLVMNNMKYMAGFPKFGILNLNLEPPEIIWFLSPSIKVSWSKEQTKAEVRWASQTFQSSSRHANMNICFVLVFFLKELHDAKNNFFANSVLCDKQSNSCLWTLRWEIFNETHWYLTKP